jgi:hypothetical protein
MKKEISKQVSIKSRGPLGNTSKTYVPNKLENVEEIGKFLAVFEQPKLNQEYINHQ